jgi:hypothetical protein
MFAAAIAIVLGIACLRIEPPACSGPSFRAAGLSCELLGKDITN